MKHKSTMDLFQLLDLDEPATDLVIEPVEVIADDGNDADAAPDINERLFDAELGAQRLVVDDNDDGFQLTSDEGVYASNQIIDEAFRWFREQGFPYRTMPKFVMWQQVNRLSRAPHDALARTAEAYAVADAHQPHRFHATTGDRTSPFECFNNDVKFRHALALRLEQQDFIPPAYFSQIALSRHTQQCSNFRPGFACFLYREFCKPGANVLDTSTGYGGRLVGYVASKIGGRYIGIDPNTATHAGNVKLAADLCCADRVELHCAAVEDLDPLQFADRCDFAFTSPPYFSKEHYSDEPTQSWVRYGHSFEAWVQGFLRPMLLLTFLSLRPDARAVINIEDVKIRGEVFPLVDRTIQHAIEVGFRHEGSEFFNMATRLGANQEPGVASERVLIFAKP